MQYQPACCREPGARGLRSALTVDESRTDDPGVGMVVEHLDQRLDRSGVQMGIGIEHQRVFAGPGGHALVRCTAITDVGRRPQQACSRMVAQYARGIVGRSGVVDDEHFPDTGCGLSRDRTQAFVQQIGRFVVDDDDVEATPGCVRRGRVHLQPATVTRGLYPPSFGRLPWGYSPC